MSVRLWLARITATGLLGLSHKMACRLVRIGLSVMAIHQPFMLKCCLPIEASVKKCFPITLPAIRWGYMCCSLVPKKPILISLIIRYGWVSAIKNYCMIFLTAKFWQMISLYMCIARPLPMQALPQRDATAFMCSVQCQICKVILIGKKKGRLYKNVLLPR